MTDRIEEITQKIYNEGVVKAKEDARRIVSEANNKAEEIIREAKKREAEIISRAQQETDEMKKKTETELRLAARQFISEIKQKVVELVTTEQVEGHIKNAWNDKEFIQRIIFNILQNWKPDDNRDLLIILPEKNKNELNTFLESKALEALNRSLEVSFDPAIGSGFKIGPKNGGYIISFTDKDFVNYFKRYLKERTRNLLFDSSGKVKM